MWYFIIGLIITVIITVIQANASMEEFEKDVYTGNWWLAMLYIVALWPIFILALILVAIKKKV